MARVVALQNFVGSYPVGAGEQGDFVQNERRVKDNGELVVVQVAYASVVVHMTQRRTATPGDRLDDAARVKRGGDSWIEGDMLTVPGKVVAKGRTYVGSDGAEPAFEVPDVTAKRWADAGLILIVDSDEADEVSIDAPPSGSDPRQAPSSRRRVAPGSPAGPQQAQE